MALMGMIRRCLLPVACILGWLPSCIATLSNRTIDDTKGDPITGFLPIYAPESHWNLVSTLFLYSFVGYYNSETGY
jgi:hypothetical protein